jgi:outer membrane protein OmpA-like peptidoglycan-associated protein
MLFKSKSALMSAVLCISTLTACAQAPQASCEPSSIDQKAKVSKEIAIVIAPNLGFVDFENVMKSALPKVQEVFADNKNATLSVVLADGSPEIQSSSVIDVEQFGFTQTDIDEEVDNAISEISRVYRCTLGLDGVSYDTTGESDLTLAFAKAAAAFEIPESQKEIFVLSNGLSTAGQVNFSKDGMPSTENFTSMVDQYEEQNALFDLKGASVSWIGLGQTDDNFQEKLGTQSIDSLVKFWKLMITKSNGTPSAVNAGNVVSGAPNPGSLAVSKVTASDKKACINATLDEDQGLIFNPNDTSFENDSIARRSVETIAKKIIDSECVGKIVVTGYVASNTDEATFDRVGDISLSFDRASVVKSLLIEFGVTAEIEAIGAGWGKKPDWDMAGKFDDELGKANRIVKITQ